MPSIRLVGRYLTNSGAKSEWIVQGHPANQHIHCPRMAFTTVVAVWFRKRTIVFFSRFLWVTIQKKLTIVLN